MLYRQLGTTGLQMTAFSFCTWQTFGETVDLATADRIVSVDRLDAGLMQKLAGILEG